MNLFTNQKRETHIENKRKITKGIRKGRDKLEDWD